MLLKILRSPWPSLVWAGIIFYLLAADSKSLGVKHLPFANADKIVHAILFGTLVGWLWFYAKSKWTGSIGKLVLLLFIASAGYGTAMEFYQKYFTTRAFELNDIVADSVGAALAASFFYILQKRRPL